MFEHLSRLDPTKRTHWMDLPMVSPGAAVELRFAGEGNAEYYSAMLARAGRRVRKAAKGANIATLDQATLALSSLEENRAEDRELFPAHVLINWRGIATPDGQGGWLAVEPSLENRRKFCAMLPTWIFDRIRNVAASPEKFVGEDETATPDPKELAGNSLPASAGN